MREVFVETQHLVTPAHALVGLGDAHRLPYFGRVVALAEFFQALRQACMLLFHRIQVEGWDAVKQTDGRIAKAVDAVLGVSVGATEQPTGLAAGRAPDQGPVARVELL